MNILKDCLWVTWFFGTLSYALHAWGFIGSLPYVNLVTQVCVFVMVAFVWLSVSIGYNPYLNRMADIKEEA